jgi:IS5 family transposase
MEGIMARRSYRQLGMADLLVRKRKSKRVNRLEKMDELIDWRAVDRLLEKLSNSCKGAPAYPPLCLVKALLLGGWHDLSDPALEDAIADRLSFRKFVGIPLDEVTPDETTFVRFRARLREHGLYERIFEEVNRQLDEKGMILRKGTLVDATIVEANARRPGKKEGDVSMTDVDATFTMKHGKTCFGYKMHIGVDEGSGLIRRVIGATASIHDSLAFKGLICGDEEAAYGDKAYGSKEHRKWLGELGVKDRLMHKATRGKPLLNWQKWFNVAVSGTRFQVEQFFGIGKQNYGLARARYRGEERVEGHFFLLATCYNLRRALSLS